MQHLLEQRPRGHRGERVSDDPADLLAEDQDQQVLLGARIEEQSACADICGCRDLAGGGGVEALAPEQFSGRALYPLELVTLAAFDPAWSLVLHFLWKLSTLSFERAQYLVKIRPICQTPG